MKYPEFQIVTIILNNYLSISRNQIFEYISIRIQNLYLAVIVSNLFSLFLKKQFFSHFHLLRFSFQLKSYPPDHLNIEIDLKNSLITYKIACMSWEKNFNSNGNYTVNFVPRCDRSYVQTFAFRNRSEGVNVIAEARFERHVCK